MLPNRTECWGVSLWNVLWNYILSLKNLTFRKMNYKRYVKYKLHCCSKNRSNIRVREEWFQFTNLRFIPFIPPVVYHKVLWIHLILRWIMNLIRDCVLLNTNPRSVWCINTYIYIYIWFYKLLALTNCGGCLMITFEKPWNFPLRKLSKEMSRRPRCQESVRRVWTNKSGYLTRLI